MNIESVVRAGVLGASGYTGLELCRLLLRHPAVELAFATSQSEAGRPLGPAVRAATALRLCRAEEARLEGCEVVFSCLPHGESLGWVERARAAGARVVDLSSDLRVPASDAPAWMAERVYGLTELYRAEVAGAAVVANPGCYPTAALLALAPALRRGWVAGPVIVHASSGVTGAGRAPKRELLFGEVAEDYRAYALGNTHRHLLELRDQTRRLADQPAPELVFAPHLLPVRRGILETIHLPLRADVDPAAAAGAWLDDYADEPFVAVHEHTAPSLADVVGTNRVAMHVAAVAGVSAPMLQLTVAIDNLLKGASGQAVQNMNLMFGRAETEGLT